VDQTAWGLIAIGVAFVVFRKQAARHNEWLQRLIYRDQKPFDATTLEGYEIVSAIFGVLMVILGVLSLLGLLPAPS
jgi:uncharacterized membrane protein